MLKNADSILEVDKIGKLYSRREAATRQRLAATFTRTLLGRKYRAPTDLKKGEFWSLKDINFSLNRGDAIGIIGFNGAGKTTLLRILSGQILPDEGEVRVVGNSAAMIDLTAGFNSGASGRRNIFIRGTALGRSREEVKSTLDEIIEFSELGDAIDAPFSTYSSGMKMRLAFAIMIVSRPDILFIDEILSVGDFVFQQKCLAKIREIREKVAFVLVSHSMANIKLFCNKAIVLHEGQIAFAGEPEEAIALYEEMRFPEKISQSEKRAEILKPQFHNTKTIFDVEHFWCDKDGQRIDEIRSGDDLYFHLSFKLNYKPRNLILGVPIWTNEGVYVTGFSSPRAGKGLSVNKDENTKYILSVPKLAFNPGIYVSNIAINDGPEFLYRAANPTLNVLSSGKDSWGCVQLPHNWKSAQQKAKSVR